MHILFNQKERTAISKMLPQIPNDTTLVESNLEGEPLRRWIVNNGELQLETDFVEKNRSWKKGEREKFLFNVTPERVIDFFLQDPDDCPRREYSAMCDKENTLLHFCRHAGMYQPDQASGERRNIFRITLNADSDIEAAEKEIKWVFAKVAAAYLKWNPIYIGIFEHTLSEHGTFYILWNRKDSFKLMKVAWGREHEIAVFSSWRNVLEYVAKNHYYLKSTNELA